MRLRTNSPSRSKPTGGIGRPPLFQHWCPAVVSGPETLDSAMSARAAGDPSRNSPRGRAGEGLPCAMKESIHFILKSGPFEDSLEVQGAAYLPHQAIQSPLSVLPPVTKLRGGCELVEGSRCSKKFMTKDVLFKKPV